MGAAKWFLGERYTPTAYTEMRHYIRRPEELSTVGLL